jgi:hypothetical protein
MSEKLEKCTMYIDYEGLLVGLSQRQYWNIRQVMPELLDKAASHFQAQQAYVFGNWSSLASRAELENLGFSCLHNLNPGHAPIAEIQRHITDALAAGNVSDTYIIVGSDHNYSSILRHLNRLNKTGVLWTVLPPTADEQALCASWETISLPGDSETSLWPRQVMLHAVVLTADQLALEDTPFFLMNHLLNHLQTLSAFHNSAETWLSIALREQVILQKTSDYGFGSGYAYLNQQSPVVRKAIQTRKRILSVLNVMIAGRDWVAFSAAEKALRTANTLAGSQQLRHAWLEMLVAENILIADNLSKPGAAHQTTTLKLNREHPAVRSSVLEQERNLIYLVVAADNFMKRKNSNWISISKLLEILTKATTRVEARAALEFAKTKEIVHIDSVPAHRDQDYTVATAKLNYEDTFVQEALKKRDHAIWLTNYILSDREFLSEDIGIGRILLEDELMASARVEQDMASFWVETLLMEGILSEITYIAGSLGAERLLRLRVGDPVVGHALAQDRQSLREV